MTSNCLYRGVMMTGFAWLVAATTAWGQQAAGTIADKNSPLNTGSANVGGQAYLGVEVDSLHPSFATHLGSVLTNGQGVLVTFVSPDSAAEKAGLKEHDILTTYNDQKLFAPEQLAKLVRADRPQQAVTLGIVREGKSQQLQVTLGSRPQGANNYSDQWERGPWNNWGFPEQPAFQAQQQPRNPDSAWESFDSLTLKKTGDHQFKVEVQYLDKSGKMQKHDFAGTREQIRQSIESEKDLPQNERDQLLSSLGMNSGTIDRSAQYPFWHYGPWGRPY